MRSIHGIFFVCCVFRKFEMIHRNLEEDVISSAINHYIWMNLSNKSFERKSIRVHSDKSKSKIPKRQIYVSTNRENKQNEKDETQAARKFHISTAHLVRIDSTRALAL